MKLDWKKIKEGFHPSWHPYMKEVMESKEVWEIFQTLKTSTEIVTPKSQNLFKSFEVDLNHMSVLIMGQDPYPQVDMSGHKANGIAFDCRNYGGISMSLEKLYEAMEDDAYNGLNLMYDLKNPDLSYLINQGVMLTNSALTCVKNRADAHARLWFPFWKLVFNKCFAHKTGLIFIFMGNRAKELIDYTSDIHHILSCEHPVAASYAKRKMNHNNVFSRANELLLGMNNFKMCWLLDEDVPF